jgi:hypothetical protein
MIGSGPIGFLLTIIVIAAAVYLIYILINPAQIPLPLKYATYILIFIIILFWAARYVLPLLGLSL